jgi:hypothetical protein
VCVRDGDFCLAQNFSTPLKMGWNFISHRFYADEPHGFYTEICAKSALISARCGQLKGFFSKKTAPRSGQKPRSEGLAHSKKTTLGHRPKTLGAALKAACSPRPAKRHCPAMYERSLMRGDTSMNSSAVPKQIPQNSQKKPAPWNCAKKPPFLMFVWMIETSTLPSVMDSR